jgi:sugar phosphate isomerase/epimerase
LNPTPFARERFGYHVVYDRDLLDAVDYAADHGFGYIVPDLMIPRFFPENLDRQERRRIRQYAESRDVSLSFHAPSDNLNLVAPYPEVQRAVLKRMRLSLRLAQDLGAERFTVHSTAPLNFASDGKKGTYLQDHWQVYKTALSESLKGILESAGRVQVCVENAPLDELTEEVLEDLLNEENLFLTWDVPKSLDPAHGSPPERVEAFLLHHLNRIRECHLYDRRPGGYGHDQLGAGSLDYGRYLKLLAPHDVHFTLEIRPRENAYTSLLKIKELWKAEIEPV